MSGLKILQKKLDYAFHQPQLLADALTHRSALQNTRDLDVDNERLEFLGDRILNFCVAEILYHEYPDEPEGVLSKRHAALVKESTLAEIALVLDLGSHLTLGRGEDASGGRGKSSILSDALEAVIAALYMDGGMDVARFFVRRHWQPRIPHVRVKDAKSRLQEWLQANGHPLPEYHVIEIKGEAHARIFVMEVVTRAFGRAQGEGPSKQAAQQAAAEALLQTMPQPGL